MQFTGSVTSVPVAQAQDSLAGDSNRIESTDNASQASWKSKIVKIPEFWDDEYIFIPHFSDNCQTAANLLYILCSDVNIERNHGNITTGGGIE